MRKIEHVLNLKKSGLSTVEVREFTHDEMDEMKLYAEELIRKYGGFNLRTDSLMDNPHLNFNLPFIKDCTIPELEKAVRENGSKISYLIQQCVDDSKLLFNAVLRVIDNKLVGELNKADKTSLRHAMKNAQNLEIINHNTKTFSPALKRISADISRTNLNGWVEVSAYNNNELIYWQVRPEKTSNEELKKLFNINTKN